MNALAHSYLFWIALILGLLGLYILPSVIAAIRGVEGLGWIIVINLLPTGVGWLAALIGALMLPRREPPAAPVPSWSGAWSYAPVTHTPGTPSPSPWPHRSPPPG
jgi:Superinfection immunity protein